MQLKRERCFNYFFICVLFIAIGCGGGGGGGGDGGDGDEGEYDGGVQEDIDYSTEGETGIEVDAGFEVGDIAEIGDFEIDGQTVCIDIDRDGYCRPDDCDDENKTINLGMGEVCGNAFDDNCNGKVDEDCYGDGNTYFVDKDSIGGTCSDSNPGTIDRPWCTIAKANSTLGGGDTVFIRAGVYEGETIQPSNSGNSDSSRITYASYEGEEVVFTHSVYCIRIQSKSYITIRGLKFIDCERNLYISSSDHINVGYCSFDNPGGPVTWAGSRIYSNSTYNKIYNNVFSRYGNESGGDGNWDDNACILDIGNDNEVDESDYNLVVGNTFYYGGHHILGVYSNYNVVRNNTFHNEEWYPCHRESIGGMCGNRNVILNTSYPDKNIGNIIENNMITFSGVPPDNNTSTGLSVRTQFNIIRRNIFYYNDSSGVGLSADGGNYNDASNNYVYNNTFYHNGYTLFEDWEPTKSGMLLARWVDDSQHNPMTGVAIKNNIFYDNNLYAIYFYYVDRTQQYVEGNWEEEGDPGFVDISKTPEPFDFSSLNLHLNATSPCINNGVFLTRTLNSGEESNVLMVEDANYFTDGNGVVEGDMIQFEGSDMAVTITEIDYSTGRITIDTPMTWSQRTWIALPYFGTAPDQGAYEVEQ